MKLLLLSAVLLVWLVADTRGKILESEEPPRFGRVKRQATCGRGFPRRQSVSFVKQNSRPAYRYPFGKAKIVRMKRRILNGLPAPPQDIRLRAEKRDMNPNEGRVEVFHLGQYGMICDGYWDRDDADVACRQLGFEQGALRWPRNSSFGISRIMGTVDVMIGEIRCTGSEDRIQDCPSKPFPICRKSKTTGVICIVNEGCPYGWSASNGMCYRVVEKRRTYEQAVEFCKTLKAKPLYILSKKDNNYLSDMLSLKWPKTKAFWTGGQWRETTTVRGRRYGAWVWGDLYQTVSPEMQKLFFPGFYKWKRGKRPIPDFKQKSCIAMNRIYLDTDRRNQTTDVNYFWWDNVSCKQRLPFVCQRPYFEQNYMERNCYQARGVEYRGNVSRTDKGSPCQKWTTKGAPLNPGNAPNKGLGDHSYCRNPDNDVKPWCWVDAAKGVYGFCNVKRCDLMPTASTPLFTRKVGTFGYGNGGCKKEQFFCPSMYRYKEKCLERSDVCDGKSNCVESEDENDDFCKKFACGEKEFFCVRDKYCIPNDRRCDGARDCSDGADERNCPSKGHTLNQFDCKPRSILNIKKLVYRAETLEQCAEKCSRSATRVGTVCVSFNFLPKDEKTRWFSECQLLAKNAESSGKKLTTDPSATHCRFKKSCVGDIVSCKNGRCIDKRYKCNGVDDCGDRSDEAGCKAPDASAGINLPFKVRLAGSKDKWSGRVEVRYKGQWGLVCDDNFDMDEANVICKQLGFKRARKAVRNSQLLFGRGNGNFLMDDVKCKGTETSLAKCPFNGWGKSNCAANEVAGVVCDVSRACSEDEYRCAADGQCIAMSKVCDGRKDCAEGSDEEDCKVDLRLTDGPNKKEGRVVIRRNYMKGTICDDQFDDRDAEVICRQLGFKGKAKALLSGKYGGGKGLIWLADLNCKGSETKLLDCPGLKWASSKCDHSEDVGVRCGVQDASTPDQPEKPGTGDVLKMPWKKILNLTIPCGERPGFDGRRRRRGISGYAATPGLIPWQAGVRKFTRNMKYQGHHCGGTIISEYWLLTAAHCYNNNLPKTRYVVRIGDLDNSKNDTGEQWFQIDQMITHPNWTGPPKYDYDLTLFKLKPNNGRGIIFNKNVQPACMPTADIDVSRGHSCYVSGWGSLGGFRYPKILQVADIPMIDWDDCKILYKDFTKRMQCAGFKAGGIDTCQGDSGGPLVCKVNGKFTAWGQCSWGNGCALPNNPGVYARVKAFRDWIKETISKY